MSGKPGKSGRPKNPPKARQLLKDIIPIGQMFNEEEVKIYESLIDVYLNDFDEEDLTSNDMDDIMTLAMNKVQEIRLLTTAKNDADQLATVTPSLEKIKKQTEKIKESLATRRKDRVDPNKYKGFSIIDLAIAFDEERKQSQMNKVRKNKSEEEDVLKSREDYVGNRYDIDTDGEDKE